MRWQGRPQSKNVEDRRFETWAPVAGMPIMQVPLRRAHAGVRPNVAYLDDTSELGNGPTSLLLETLEPAQFEVSVTLLEAGGFAINHIPDDKQPGR